MPSVKVSRPTRRRMLAAVTAASVIGSLVATTAPASAQMVSCNSHTKNWAALYPSFLGWEFGSGATDCFGFVSINFPPSNATIIFCAGNNSGLVTYYDEKTGATVTHSFWPGTSYAVEDGTYVQASPFDTLVTHMDVIDVETVQINGYSGGAGCGGF